MGVKDETHLRDKLRAVRATTLANAARDTCVFVPVPPTRGHIALWHFPSKQQLTIAKVLADAYAYPPPILNVPVS